VDDRISTYTWWMDSAGPPGACMARCRSGTPSQGKFYLLFEGGPKSWDEAVQVAVFNLSWLLDGRDITSLLGKLR